MERRQITIAVGLIVNDNGEILLPRRHQPENPEIHNKWEFPGGGIEFNEDPEATVIREVKEETGLDVKVIRLLPKVFSNFWPSAEKELQVLILSYECKVTGGTLGSTDPEIGELKYFKLEEVDYPNSFPKTKEIIDLLKL